MGEHGTSGRGRLRPVATVAPARFGKVKRDYPQLPSHQRGSAQRGRLRVLLSAPIELRRTPLRAGGLGARCAARGCGFVSVIVLMSDPGTGKVVWHALGWPIAPQLRAQVRLSD